MVSVAPQLRMTEDEYLAFERASEEKHEYIDGEIFAMSGATREHGLISLGIGAELRAVLRGRRCEVYNNDVRVYMPGSRRYVYPDASVACGRPQFKDKKLDTLLNPRIIVEVLSPSTEDYDREDKFNHYKPIPSLAHYVIASQEKPLVEVFTRQADGSWSLETYEAGQKFALPALECEIEVDQVYAGVFDVVPEYVSVD
jgi:Uma2 family endonuclease